MLLEWKQLTFIFCWRRKTIQIERIRLNEQEQSQNWLKGNESETKTELKIEKIGLRQQNIVRNRDFKRKTTF